MSSLRLSLRILRGRRFLSQNAQQGEANNARYAPPSQLVQASIQGYFAHFAVALIELVCQTKLRTLH